MIIIIIDLTLFALAAADLKQRYLQAFTLASPVSKIRGHMIIEPSIGILQLYKNEAAVNAKLELAEGCYDQLLF